HRDLGVEAGLRLVVEIGLVVAEMDRRDQQGAKRGRLRSRGSGGLTVRIFLGATGGVRRSAVRGVDRVLNAALLGEAQAIGVDGRRLRDGRRFWLLLTPFDGSDAQDCEDGGCNMAEANHGSFSN